MNRTLELYAPLFGRILLGGFFLWNGIQEILNFPTTVAIYSHGGFSNATVFATVASAIEVLGGIAIVTGVRIRFAAATLIIYLLCTSVVFMTVQSQTYTQLFLENFAVIGGLLYIMTYGSGRWSADWK